MINDLSKMLSKYINMDEILKNGTKIYQILSYGQENINNLKIFEESNIEDFKKALLIQINYLYKKYERRICQ